MYVARYVSFEIKWLNEAFVFHICFFREKYSNFLFSEFDWVVVNRTGDVIPFVDSASNGLVVTSVLVPPVMYISAPSLFLGTQFRSYGQRLHVKVRISR